MCSRVLHPSQTVSQVVNEQLRSGDQLRLAVRTLPVTGLEWTGFSVGGEVVDQNVAKCSIK